MKPISYNQLSAESSEIFTSSKDVKLVCPYCGNNFVGCGHKNNDKGICRSAIGDGHLMLFCTKCKKHLNFNFGHMFYTEGYGYGRLEKTIEIAKKLGLEDIVDDELLEEDNNKEKNNAKE